MRHEYTVQYQTIEDGWIMASVPELPGAVTEAPNMEEARRMIREVVELLLDAYRDNAAREAPSGVLTEVLTVDLPAG